jgi:hypothetical protein
LRSPERLLLRIVESRKRSNSLYQTRGNALAISTVILTDDYSKNKDPLVRAPSPNQRIARLLLTQGGSAVMERPGIHELAIRDQLKTRRNLLFNEFLRNPLNTSLAIEIKSIDDRIAELMGRLSQEEKSKQD